MQKTKILIIHQEESKLLFLKNALKIYSYEILAETDSERGFNIVKKESPHAVLAQTRMDGMDGFHLCWMIRQSSGIASTPFILMTETVNPEERINAFRSGVDAYIDQETSAREIHTLIEAFSRRIEQINSHDKSMRGKIADFSVVEILQMLHNARKSGTLILKEQDKTGEIGFSSGNIVWSAYKNRSGKDAVLKLTSFINGFFIFDKNRLPAGTNIKTPTMQLILNCCKKLDEKQD